MLPRPRPPSCLSATKTVPSRTSPARLWRDDCVDAVSAQVIKTDDVTGFSWWSRRKYSTAQNELGSSFPRFPSFSDRGEGGSRLMTCKPHGMLESASSLSLPSLGGSPAGRTSVSELGEPAPQTYTLAEHERSPDIPCASPCVPVAFDCIRHRRPLVGVFSRVCSIKGVKRPGAQASPLLDVAKRTIRTIRTIRFIRPGRTICQVVSRTRSPGVKSEFMNSTECKYTHVCLHALAQAIQALSQIVEARDG